MRIFGETGSLAATAGAAGKCTAALVACGATEETAAVLAVVFGVLVKVIIDEVRDRFRRRPPASAADGDAPR